MKKYKKLLFATACIIIGLSCFAQNADINLLKSINKNETSLKNKYLELNASSVTAVSIAAPASMALAGFILHDKKLKRDALYTGAAFLASSIVTRATKVITNRQRPFEKYSFIIKRDDESGGHSFPSGHTSSAFCTATSLSLRYRKWYVIAPAYIFATSVGWARMYQGVHYPSDVLAGALVGTCSAWLGYKAQKWFTDKKEQKKKVTL